MHKQTQYSNRYVRYLLGGPSEVRGRSSELAQCREMACDLRRENGMHEGPGAWVKHHQQHRMSHTAGDRACEHRAVQRWTEVRLRKAPDSELC